MTLIRSWLCVALVCLAATSCAAPSRLSFGDPLREPLTELRDSGESGRLSDLTDFDWDEVSLFHEGTPRERIEQITGDPLIRDEYYFSSPTLLVFENHGKVVKAVPTGAFLRSKEGRTTWPHDVLLEPWGDGFLGLTLPPGATP